MENENIFSQLESLALVGKLVWKLGVSPNKNNKETSIWEISKSKDTAKEQTKQQFFLLENGCMHMPAPPCFQW